jgi:hypothetical protein
MRFRPLLSLLVLFTACGGSIAEPPPGSCTAGLGGTELTPASVNPISLALDGDAIVLATTDGIWRAGGDGANLHRIGGSGVAYEITVAAGRAFWTNDLAPGSASTSQVGTYMMPAAGGDATRLGRFVPSVSPIAADADGVYFGAGAPPFRASLDGTKLQNLPFEGRVSALTTDARAIYGWQSRDQRVVRIDKATLAVTTVAAPDAEVVSIAVDDHALYWAAESGIMRAALDGSGESRVSSAKNAYDVRVDERHVYWLEDDDSPTLAHGIGGRVLAAPSSGGAATTIASGLSHPNHLVLGRESVYWLDSLHDGPAQSTLKTACKAQ